MVKTQTTNAGPVGLKPKGEYKATTPYTLLDLVRHGYESWVCTAINADGTAGTVTGEEPAAAAQHWMALTNFTQLVAAVNASAQNANTAAGNANAKATLADEKADYAAQQGDYAKAQGELASTKATLASTNADYASQQGNYAKEQGDRAKSIADYPDQIRSDGYVWRYDPAAEGAGEDGYRKTGYKVDASLDFDALTQEQYESLVSRIKENMLFASDATCEGIVDELA